MTSLSLQPSPDSKESKADFTSTSNVVTFHDEPSSSASPSRNNSSITVSTTVNSTRSPASAAHSRAASNADFKRQGAEFKLRTKSERTLASPLPNSPRFNAFKARRNEGTGNKLEANNRENDNETRDAGEATMRYLSLSDEFDQPYERALFCLAPSLPLRQLMIRVSRSNAFRVAVLVVILVNSLLLASNADVPIAVKITIWSLFSLEMAIKVLAQGFVFAGPASYLRDGWNMLDCAVIIFLCVRKP